MEREDFTFYDLRRREKSKSIELLFPGWVEGEERVAIFCPHDDDGILGPGIFCRPFLFLGRSAV